MEINKALLEAEFKELAGDVTLKLKLNNRITAASSMTFTDNSISIVLNPKRFRSQSKLDTHLNMIRQELTSQF